MDCRGSILVTRLGMYYPARFAGFAFLASGYCPPLPGFDLKVVLEHQQQYLYNEAPEVEQANGLGPSS